MKKLYENIENIYIKGGIHQLTEVVTVIDKGMQSVVMNTDTLISYLMKYSSSNMGAQYEKVVNTTNKLRDVLYEASVELNEMQNQIVAYQNKIYRYEDMNTSEQKPNPYIVNKERRVDINTTAMRFSRTDMIDLAKQIRSYSTGVYGSAKTINDKKNSVASIWQDSQYNDFSQFIDEVNRKIVEALKVYEEYVIYLESKIKELSN